jgi:ATP-dependent RNA helicase SUPV3L1/SUV3
VAHRLDRLERDTPDAFGLALDERNPDQIGTLAWRDQPVARLIGGDSVSKPRLRLIRVDLLDSAQKERLRRRLTLWLSDYLDAFHAPLHRLDALGASPAVRGLVFQLAEALGLVPRQSVDELVHRLSEADRINLKTHGVRLGRLAVFVRPMLTRERALLRALLWSVAQGAETPAFLPGRGRVSVPVDPALPAAHYEALGFLPLGPRALRVDIAERLITALKRRAKHGSFSIDAELGALAGCPRRELAGVLAALGYLPETDEPGALYREATRPRPAAEARAARSARRRVSDPHSPFAKLAALRRNPEAAS